MFEDALLDSSPRQASVLPSNSLSVFRLRGHPLLRAGYVPVAFAAGAGGRASAIDCGDDGRGCAPPSMRLMLCYVWADARQHDLRAVAMDRGHSPAEPAGISDLPCLLRTENRRLETRRHSAGIRCGVDTRRRADSLSADLHSGIAEAVANYRHSYPPPPGPPPAPPRGEASADRRRDMPAWIRLPSPSEFQRPLPNCRTS